MATYIVEMEETSLPGAPVSQVGQFPGSQTRVAVKNLKANTYYTFFVRIVLGFFMYNVLHVFFFLYENVLRCLENQSFLA